METCNGRRKFLQPYDYFEFGISNYWGVPLHNRVLKVDRYRQMLDKKLTNLMTFLTPERIKGMLEEYKKVTDLYTLAMPDVNALYAPLDEYQKSYQDNTRMIYRLITICILNP